MSYELNGKVAVVTGASKGLGRMLSQELAYRGAEVIGVARSEPDLKALQEEIAAQNGKFTYILADLLKPEDRARIAETVYDMGGCNILINNAGEFKLDYPEKMKISDMERMVLLDLVAPTELYESLKRGYKKGHEDGRSPRKLERVLWIGSVSGLFSWAGDPLYQSVKTAISIYARGERLSLEYQKEQARYSQDAREFFGPQLGLDIKHIVLYIDTTETDTLRKVIGESLNDRWKRNKWHVIKRDYIKDTIISGSIKALTGEDGYENHDNIAIMAYPSDNADGVHSVGIPINPVTNRIDVEEGKSIERLAGSESLAKLIDIIGK